MVELRRVDIITEVSMLVLFLSIPREGHLEAVFHIDAYLDKRHNSRMVFDLTYPDIDLSELKECSWKDFYGDVKEALPPNAPSPRGCSSTLGYMLTLITRVTQQTGVCKQDSSYF